MKVPRADGLAEVVVALGDETRPMVEVGTVDTASHAERLLTWGARYGVLVFAAAEWRERGVVGTVTPGAEANDVWRDGDLLVADARDDAGLLKALVQFDRPLDGRRRSPHELVRLSEELHLSIGALLSVVENELLAPHVRVGTQMRALVRDLDRRATQDDLVTLVQRQLRAAFRARVLHLYLHADEDDPAVGDLPLSGELYADLTASLARAWETGDTLIVEGPDLWGDASFAGRHGDEMADLLSSHGIATLVMVPIGAEGRHLGTLGIARAVGDPRWTDSESRAAIEVGRDLGRVVLNVRGYTREQRLRRELERLDEYRSQLIATISHELKNPIGVIQGHLELLQDEVDPGAERSLHAIGRGAQRLATLADDLLVLSRVGNSERPMRRTRVDMAEIVREGVDFSQVVAERAGVTLTVSADDGKGHVIGNREALTLVVTNLLSNAIKYSDAGDRVHLRVQRRGDRVVLTCTDTGLGISPDDQKHLFDEFFRSTNPAATSRPGTGLGLVILQRVVTRHAGFIAVDSELGVGTTVEISLPGVQLPRAGGLPGT